MTETPSSPGVVVGVDHSEEAALAARWAAAEATARGVGLRLVCAWDDESFVTGPGKPVTVDDYQKAQHKEVSQLLDEIDGRLRDAFPELALTRRIVEEKPADALVTASRSAELVVVGARGHGGFAGLLLGSVSLGLVAHTRCPAVVVRQGNEHDAGREVVLAVDVDEPQPPIAFAFSSAARMGVGVRAVHCTREHGFGAGSDEHEAGNRLEGLLREAREGFPNVPVETNVVRGNPTKSVIDVASGARLLVVGSHRDHGPLSLGIGNVLHGLVHHAPCPVAVIPSD